MPTGAKLSKTRYVPRADQEWLWPANDSTQHAIAWARLADLERALDFIGAPRICVQAGGNMGVWPKRLSRVFDTVYTFEPDPLNFRCLCANVPEENVFKFNAALGTGHESPADMRRTDNCGAHKVIPGAGNIPLISLDALNLPGCDFLQLDIEGHEAHALAGAWGTIRAYHPVIMIEDKAFKRRAIERGEGIEKAESECSKLLRSWGYDIAEAFTDNGSCDFLYVWRDF